MQGSHRDSGIGTKRVLNMSRIPLIVFGFRVMNGRARSQADDQNTDDHTDERKRGKSDPGLRQRPRVDAALSEERISVKEINR